MADGTVIDKLVVTLGLDSSKFAEGSRKALDAFAKTKTDAAKAATDMEASGKKAADFFGAIKKEALGLFAVIVGAGGLEQFVAKTASGTAALGRLAPLIGVSAQNLQAFRMVIQRTGADGDAAVASLTNLSQALENYVVFGRPLSQSMLVGLNQIGANPTDDPIEVYRKFAKWAQGKNGRLVNLEGGLLGLDPGTISNALRGLQTFDAEMARSRQYVPTKDEVDMANALVGAFHNLRQAVSALAMHEIFNAAETKQFGQMAADADKLGTAISKVNDDLVGMGISAKNGFAVLFGLIDKILKEFTHFASAADAAAHGKWGDAAKEAWAGIKESPAGALVNWGARKLKGAPAAPAAIAPAARAAAAASGLPAGVLAGLFAESRMNPQAFNAAGGGRGAQGIAQWRGSRLDDFRAFIGKDVFQSTLADQLRFVMHELTTNKAYAPILAAKDPGAQLEAFIRLFEAPGPGVAGDLARGRRYLASAGRMGAPNVTIGQITIQTAATDAKGIARGLGGAIRQNIGQQANTGLTG